MSSSPFSSDSLPVALCRSPPWCCHRLLRTCLILVREWAWPTFWMRSLRWAVRLLLERFWVPRMVATSACSCLRAFLCLWQGYSWESRGCWRLGGDFGSRCSDQEYKVSWKHASYTNRFLRTFSSLLIFLIVLYTTQAAKFFFTWSSSVPGAGCCKLSLPRQASPLVPKCKPSQQDTHQLSLTRTFRKYIKLLHLQRPPARHDQCPVCHWRTRANVKLRWYVLG